MASWAPIAQILVANSRETTVERNIVVVAREGREEIAIRPRCYVTLTIDHRVLDGHQANLFMQTLVRRIEGWS